MTTREEFDKTLDAMPREARLVAEVVMQNDTTYTCPQLIVLKTILFASDPTFTNERWCDALIVGTFYPLLKVNIPILDKYPELKIFLERIENESGNQSKSN